MHIICIYIFLKKIHLLPTFSTAVHHGNLLLAVLLPLAHNPLKSLRASFTDTKNCHNKQTIRSHVRKMQAESGNKASKCRIVAAEIILVRD